MLYIWLLLRFEPGLERSVAFYAFIITMLAIVVVVVLVFVVVIVIVFVIVLVFVSVFDAVFCVVFVVILVVEFLLAFVAVFVVVFVFIVFVAVFVVLTFVLPGKNVTCVYKNLALQFVRMLSPSLGSLLFTLHSLSVWHTLRSLTGGWQRRN